MTDLTTVGPDVAVFHDGLDVKVRDGLQPGTVYEFEGITFRTLAVPDGELLATFATVNDTHFGEPFCGESEEFTLGPICRPEPGDDPYSHVMSRAAAAEIAALDPSVVVAKGDLTDHGTDVEWAAFESVYRPVFGDRLHLIRGNHDAYASDVLLAGRPVQVVDLPGARLVLLDTVIPGADKGTLSTAQLDELEEIAAKSDRPVLAFSHHHVWDPDGHLAPGQSFGIDAAGSTRLIDLYTRYPRLTAYLSGHTHRNRVRRFARTGVMPWIETGCVKDFPGSWHEYRVHEGGILQIHHRISAPDALAWTEKTRQMFAGQYFYYAFGSLGDRCLSIPPRV
ncbi:metallophosphoesterase family protein [Krasilnikovia sp. M28-CT-15]|uniref:metallophosphoesterase family protein n=1 Tax=Krasilnikovia sp. M28-CT-15 TaxID=3373540 RepID=UPI003875B7B8